MLSDGIILLHDNARPHTANLVRYKLQRFGWETLQHPPYPRSFPLLLPHFWRPEETHSWTSVSFNDVVDPTAIYLFLQDGIDRFFSQWNKYTSSNYFWIKQIPLSLHSGCSFFIWLHLIHGETSISQSLKNRRLWDRALSLFDIFKIEFIRDRGGTIPINWDVDDLFYSPLYDTKAN